MMDAIRNWISIHPVITILAALLIWPLIWRPRRPAAELEPWQKEGQE